MSEEIRRLREEDLAFFAKIGAGVSHDMKNVLSVIGEYAGLLDDLLVLADAGKALDHAKLKKLAASMSGQVRKGTEILERFSRFAHAADERMASFDLTALTGNIVALAQRQVTLAGCRLEAELPDEAVPVRANPFSLQHAVFFAIQMILESMEEGQLITVKLVTQGPQSLISVSGGAASLDELADRYAGLCLAVAELKGSLETRVADGVLSLTLAIPKE